MASGSPPLLRSTELSQKVRPLLEFGCRQFDLELGVLLLTGEAYPQVVATQMPDSASDSQGVVRALQKNTWNNLFPSTEIIHFSNGSRSPWSASAWCASCHLETCLAVPVWAFEQVCGALIFASLAPRAQTFQASALDLARMLAEWVGVEIEREANAHHLNEARAEIETTTKALDQARASSRELERLKSEFLTTISHEIRTPLNAMIGMSDLLLGTTLNEEQREFVNILRKSSQGLLNLFNNMLDFSYLEAGMLALEIKEFRLAEVLEASIQPFSSQAAQKSIRIQKHVDEQLPSAWEGDPTRLRQVLQHLLANAVKFTERGEINIRVTLKTKTDSNLFVHFAIEDTGIGISSAGRQRLFQPFSQLDGSKTRRYGGLGLGLAVSKLLVEQMGGTIGFESQEGVGSVFWFTARFGLAASNRSREGQKAVRFTASRSGLSSRLEAVNRATAPLDPRVVASLRQLQPENDPEFLRNLVTLYLEQTTALLGDMHQAIVQADSSRLNFFAQRLKSSSANLGARSLAAYCAELETLARSGTTQGANEWLEKAEVAFKTVREAMQAEFLSSHLSNP